MGLKGPRGYCEKDPLNRQIFIVGHLQFVEKEHLNVALYLTGYRASTVARHAQTTVHEWYCTILKEWSAEAIHKFQGGDIDV